MRLGWIALLLLTAAPWLGAAGEIRLLVIAGGHGEKGWREMFQSMPGIQVTYASFRQNGGVMLAPERAKDFDAMLFYEAQQDAEPHWKGWMQVLEKGMPTVFLHHTLGSYESVPDTDQIFGGSVCWSWRWRAVPLPCAGKPAGTSLDDLPIRVRIADPAHPITKNMRDFDIVDESYKNYYVRPDVHVLLTTDEPTSESRIGWTHRYKNSPIVYLELGHNDKAFENANYRRLVERSIRWVVGKLDD